MLLRHNEVIIMILRRDDAFRAVCELRTPVDNTRVTIGTGMFVNSTAGQNTACGWIVTASHVARGTTDNTDIVIATREGKAVTLRLNLFGQLSGWIHHKIADISVFPIHFSSDNIQFLENRFFPFDHFNLTRNVVSRDYELTAIGFPNGLGIDGSFSPLSFRSYASSGFVTLLRADTKTPSDFFCLENPSVGGYSGCPVFDLGYSTNGIMTMTKEKTWCHGIMHGTMSDETGGKIALVTPAFYLQDILML
jgi:hypothetical protein